MASVYQVVNLDFRCRFLVFYQIMTGASMDLDVKCKKRYVNVVLLLLVINYI